jgi:hypothetical protein
LHAGYAVTMRRVAFLALTLAGFPTGSALGELVPVRHAEGMVHGFLALRTLGGETIADGDLIQTSLGDRVTSRLVFRFRDGSLHDETAVFTQSGNFRLVSDRLIQKGPSFPRSLDVTIDAVRGHVDVRSRERDGPDKVFSESLELPPDTSNGLIFTLLKNIPPTPGHAELPMVAATPRPRTVKLVVTSAGEDALSIGGSARKATHFVVKIEIGGIAGLVAPLLGKQPPDSHVWILEGEAPAFVRSEGPLAMGGPVWRIELVSPVWPPATPTKR